MAKQAPAVEELNSMSGIGLLYTLGNLPKAERKALLARLDDDATRRYVRALFYSYTQTLFFHPKGWLLLSAVGLIGWVAYDFSQ